MTRQLLPDEPPDVNVADLRRLAALFGSVPASELACAVVAVCRCRETATGRSPDARCDRQNERERERGFVTGMVTEEVVEMKGVARRVRVYKRSAVLIVGVISAMMSQLCSLSVMVRMKERCLSGALEEQVRHRS